VVDPLQPDTDRQLYDTNTDDDPGEPIAKVQAEIATLDPSKSPICCPPNREFVLSVRHEEELSAVQPKNIFA
jgi:hypothetical protein